MNAFKNVRIGHLPWILGMVFLFAFFVSRADAQDSCTNCWTNENGTYIWVDDKENLVDIQMASFPFVQAAVRGGAPTEVTLTEAAAIQIEQGVISDNNSSMLFTIVDGVAKDVNNDRVQTPIMLEAEKTYNIVSSGANGGYRIDRVADEDPSTCEGDACWTPTDPDTSVSGDEHLLWAGDESGKQDVTFSETGNLRDIVRGGMASVFTMNVPFQVEVCIGTFERLINNNYQQIVEIEGCPSPWPQNLPMLPPGTYRVTESLGDQGAYRATPIPGLGWRSDEQRDENIDRLMTGTEFFSEGWHDMPNSDSAAADAGTTAITGTIQTDAGTGANLRQTPDQNSARIIGLPENSIVTVLGVLANKNWYKVQAFDNIGWIIASGLQLTDANAVIPCLGTGCPAQG